MLEDSELDFALLKNSLEKFFASLDVPVDITRSENRSGFEQKYHGGRWDCVVTDFSIPGYSALEAIDLVVNDDESRCPILVFSGAIGEEMMVEIIKRGAWDLVLKSDLPRLGPAVLQSFKEVQSRREGAKARGAADAASLSRERFLEIVSHDIRTPLTSIQLVSEQLRKDKNLGIDTQNQINKLLRNLSRIERVVSDVLNQARLDAGCLKPSLRVLTVGAFFNDLIEEFSALAAAKNISIASSVTDELKIEADSTLLFQVFGNLIGNAIKFSTSGGRVMLSARATATQVTLSVGDDGPGIEPEKVPYIFEKFFRASSSNENGFGLGLYVCREIVTAHKGTIKVNSQVGAGTIFNVSLPSLREAVVPLELINNGTGLDNYTLLLVEDDPDLNEVLNEIFTREGYKVISVASVAEAKGVITQRIDEIALIVTDYRLGDGTGSDVLGSIPSTRRSTVKTILLSADWSLDFSVDNPKADRVLKKPINTADLLSELALLLKK